MVELSSRFWTPMGKTYGQRMRTREWREILLAERDHIIVFGLCRRLVGKPLGAGVVEVRLEPLEKENPDA